VRIVDGGERNVITRVLSGEPIGTRFLARTDPIEGRKRWILSGIGGGSVSVDAGAARALLGQGASLLAAGIAGVAHDFERGDPIDIMDRDGVRIGRGMANYSSEDVRKLAGRQSSEIEQTLGYSYGDHVVHRNDLVCYAQEETKTVEL
jgi:glutamate 5-kinase